MSMGWKPVAGFEAFPAPKFDDEVRLMYFDVTRMKTAQDELSRVVGRLLMIDHHERRPY
jgi:hypothetical protein